MSLQAARKKRRERFFLEAFFAALRLPAVILDDDREAPDFIVRIEERHVGVELTDLFITHEKGGKLLQAQESISSKIVLLAQRLYQARGAPPAQVTVCFAPAADLTRVDKHRAATAIASFVHNRQLKTWQRVDWYPEEDSHVLPDEISFVHALGIPSFDMAHWSVARAGWVAHLTTAALQSRIDEKIQKLCHYEKVVAENWLVLVADGSKPSQLLRAGSSFDPHGIKSTFAKTFFFGHPDGTVIQLGE